MEARISREQVAHVAKLARLALDGDELDVLAGELAAVLDYAADVAALDTAAVSPTAHPLPLVNVLRSDEVRPSLDPAVVLSMAPDAAEGRFRVPRILGEA